MLLKKIVFNGGIRDGCGAGFYSGRFGKQSMALKKLTNKKGYAITNIFSRKGKSTMKEETREVLMVLGIMGALVLTGGVTMGAIIAHKRPELGMSGIVFGGALGSFLTAAGIYIALSRDS